MTERRALVAALAAFFGAWLTLLAGLLWYLITND